MGTEIMGRRLYGRGAYADERGSLSRPEGERGAPPPERRIYETKFI